MSRPLLLDAFCGAGGTSEGYHQAGFEVIGIDLAWQPRYPFDFAQEDALQFLRSKSLKYFDAIHASPPCQKFSALVTNRKLQGNYPDLISLTRRLLQDSRLPYVIENVEGAPLRDYVRICGSSLLPVVQTSDGLRQVQRHRLFESNRPLSSPGCNHSYPALGVYGGGGSYRLTGDSGGFKGSHGENSLGMEIDWMTGAELSQAIPPAFTRLIGRQLLKALN